MLPRLLSKEDVAERELYRALNQPATVGDKVEAYAKWAFGGTTALTALTGFFSFTMLGGLGPTGRNVFAVALVCMGVSMAFSALALAPIWVRKNPNSVSDMKRAFEARLAKQRWRLGVATAGLMLALGAGAFAPLSDEVFGGVAGHGRGAPVISVSATQDGQIKAEAVATGFQSSGWVRLELKRGKALLGVAQAADDEKGQAKASVTLEKVPPGAIDVLASSPRATTASLTFVVPEAGAKVSGPVVTFSATQEGRVQVDAAMGGRGPGEWIRLQVVRGTAALAAAQSGADANGQAKASISLEKMRAGSLDIVATTSRGESETVKFVVPESPKAVR